MKRYKVLAFGIVAEKINSDEIFADGVSDSDELLRMLYSKYPQLHETKFTVSINRKIIHGNKPLGDGDEIGLLPPFSGG